MLTRSASKKKIRSPEKSVNKNEGTGAALGNAREYKVNISGFTILNGERNVCLPGTEMNLSAIPEKNVCEDGSYKIVFNLGEIVINADCGDLSPENESCKVNSMWKSPYSLPEPQQEKELTSMNVSTERNGHEDYVEFSPTITSSATKNTLRQHQQSTGRLRKLYFASDCQEGSPKCWFYKGLLVNGGYRPGDFRKKPVVELVRLSEQDITAWSSTSIQNTTVSWCHKEWSSKQKDNNVKMVKKSKLLGILKKIDLLLTKEKKNNRTNRDVLGDKIESSCSEEGNLCNWESSRSNVINQEQTTKFDTNRHISIVGDSRGKFHGFSETKEGYNEEEAEWLLDCMSDQDSIETVLFDGESVEENASPVEMREIFEKNRLNSWEVDHSSEIPNSERLNDQLPADNEETTTVAQQEKTEKLVIAEENYSSEKPEHNETDAVVEEEGNTIEDIQTRSQASRGREQVSLGCMRKTSKGKQKESVIGVGAILEKQILFTDPQTLLSVQLDCIRQEIFKRDAEVCSPAGKSKSNPSRKPSEDDVTDLPSARRVRRSMKSQEETDSKIRRNTPRTQLKENSVEQDVTPRSTRAKSLRKEIAEAEQKRRNESLLDTPRRGRESKKASPIEGRTSGTEAKESDGLSSLRSRRSRRLSNRGESRRYVSDEREQSSATSTPKKRGSPEKASQMEIVEEEGRDDEGTEEISSPKSRKSRSPTKPQNQEREKEKRDRDCDVTMEAVSSPLKKKKEAAERLRAEEELLERSPMKLRGASVASSPSPKKRRSPATPPPTVEEVSQNADTPRLSTPKKKSPSKSPVVRILVEEFSNVEVTSSPKQKQTKSPRKQGADECGTEELEEVSASSAKRQKSQSPEKRRLQEVDEGAKLELADINGAASPKRQKRKTPQKRRAEEPEMEHMEIEEVNSNDLSFPKRQKSKSPQKKPHVEHGIESVSMKLEKNCRRNRKSINVDCIVLESDEEEMCPMVSPKRQQSKSPLKERVVEREPQVKESEDVDISVTSSPKLQKSKSPVKRPTQELEDRGSMDLDISVLPSPKRQQHSSPQKKCVEDHKREEMELSDMEMAGSSPKRQKRVSAEKEQMQQDDSVVEEYMCVVSPRKQKMTRKATRPQDVEVFLTEDRNSDGMEILAEGEERSSPRKEDAGMQDSKESESATSPPERQESKSPKKPAVMEREESESDEDKICLVTTKKRQEGKSPMAKLKDEREMKDSATETDESARAPESSVPKTKKQEDGEIRISQLGQDFLSSIPSQKTSVKVKNHVRTGEEKRKRMEQKKKKLLKKLMEDDGYIPLEVGGATKFAAVGLDKFQPSGRHPAYDLKRNLLYGSRVKRIPYSQVQEYNAKVESRKLRF